MIPYFQIKSQIEKMPISKIRMHLQRERLRFSRPVLAFYCTMILRHQVELRSFQALYEGLHIKTKVRLALPNYSTWMHNLQVIAPLLQHLFLGFNRQNAIQASTLWNAVDTTLIPEKESKFITSSDWAKQRVTIRTVKKVPVKTCGSKGLIFINRRGQIIRAERLPINASDMNVLKDSAFYAKDLKGFLLADRGMTCYKTRERWGLTDCKLISPYLKKTKKDLTQKEWKLYRKRWTVETVFQQWKGTYSPVRLVLKGKYTKNIKDAKFYAAAILYNATTL